MIKRYVKFIIAKEDAITIIDRMSPYGTVRFNDLSDGRHYQVSLYCAMDSWNSLMDNILMLCRDGVSIWKLRV